MLRTEPSGLGRVGFDRSKAPDACPHCGGRALTRRGTRTKKYQLEAVPLICPHKLFRREDASGRASQAHPAFADAGRIIVNRKENAATRAAALVNPTVGNNLRRQDRLQQFMLARRLMNSVSRSWTTDAVALSLLSGASP